MSNKIAPHDGSDKKRIITGRLSGRDTHSRSCQAPAPWRRNARVSVLYVWALVREFRWSLAGIAATVLFGAVLYGSTPHPELNGQRPSPLVALYASWMAMLAQPVFSPPAAWYLTLLCGVYPLLGAVLIGEGVVRLALLLMSRRHGEKEWMRVMISTYRDHVVLCGVGRLGFRVLESLLASGVEVVALERQSAGRFVTKAKELGVPVLVRDIKEDQALVDAGISRARAIIIATNDAMGNLEVALDARRMNPRIRVVMRMFDDQIALKVAGSMKVDAAFSDATLAAPVVAAMALQMTAVGARVLSSSTIANIPHVAAEVAVQSQSTMDGRRVEDIEVKHRAKILARTGPDGHTHAPPDHSIPLCCGDVVIVHIAAEKLSGFILAASACDPAADLVAEVSR
jgi:voltage-gated potassium channel Kch